LEEVRGESSRVGHGQFHLINFLLNSSDELEDEVDELFLLVLLKVFSTDKETKVIVLMSGHTAEYFKLVSAEL